jgi:hypothetical protein
MAMGRDRGGGMEPDDWRALVLFVFFLGTLFDVFISPWLLIPDMIVLGAFIFVIYRARRNE